MVLKPAEVLANVSFSSRTAVLLMTHNYNYDLEILRILLPLQMKYVGSLGPKKKLERMLDELKETGLSVREEWLSSVYGPTGLDLGAETSEEIALSIIAEIKSVFSDTAVMPLRDKRLPIHTKI
jgi:xanthine/CO dehydrogenase XdhC/CoxF family maturation factor